MYTRYYDQYPNKNSVQKEVPKEISLAEVNEEACEETVKDDEIKTASILPGGLLGGGFNTEDILLIALLFLIATDNSDDFIMPLILGALLIG